MKETTYKKTGMDKLSVYRYQAEQIKDTFRMVANVLGSREKKTCLDRDVMVSYEIIDNVLNENIDVSVNRMKTLPIEDKTYSEKEVIEFAEWLRKERYKTYFVEYGEKYIDSESNPLSISDLLTLFNQSRNNE